MALDNFGRYTKGVEPIMSSTVVFGIWVDFFSILYSKPITPVDTNADTIAKKGFDIVILRVSYSFPLLILFLLYY